MQTLVSAAVHHKGWRRIKPVPAINSATCEIHQISTPRPRPSLKPQTKPKCSTSNTPSHCVSCNWTGPALLGSVVVGFFIVAQVGDLAFVDPVVGKRCLERRRARCDAHA